jgi:hypothetical protein
LAPELHALGLLRTVDVNQFAVNKHGILQAVASYLSTPPRTSAEAHHNGLAI